MKRVLEIFETMASIPHCSGNTHELKAYIETFCRKNGFDLLTDAAGNILARKPSSKICLQSHYDMVCIGRYENLEVIREGNTLKANGSTLGADNGIGVAMMLALIEAGADVECLFTNDEEIGLIGAKNLDLDIQSPCLLNLDSEEEGTVYIGCAGGFDFKAHIPLTKVNTQTPLYEITTHGFPGGHSGVEIDKNIPNAIKELLFFIEENDLELLYLTGGERHNSIPVHVRAVVSGKMPQGNGHIKVETSDEQVPGYDCRELARLLSAFPTGVRSWNKEYDIPHDSINLAMVGIKNDTAVVEISARSMDNRSLKKLETETRSFFKGYRLEVNDGYPAWKPELTEFAKKVLSIYRESDKNCKIGVIHAGLECAVIKDKASHIDATSIGPNIFSPHTDREYTEIDSIGRVYEVVKRIVS